jgi:regulator of protease activity HflC (stomatin/prohibitin superfamily)
MVLAVLGLILAFMTFGGFFLIHPNESKVFTFLGKYIGSALTSGFFWTNPFAVKKKVTLRIFNFNSETLKVNDALGNPIEIAAVVVWHVVDSAKALFNVESYQNFVAIQSETAIRQLATHYPYDAHDKDTESLRANPDEIAGKLKVQVQNRLDVAGLHVVEARLSHLAYAPEIAQAMLAASRPRPSSPPAARSSTAPSAWSRWPSRASKPRASSISTRRGRRPWSTTSSWPWFPNRKCIPSSIREHSTPDGK